MGTKKNRKTGIDIAILKNEDPESATAFLLNSAWAALHGSGKSLRNSDF